MFMTVAPAYLITLLTILINVILFAIAGIEPDAADAIRLETGGAIFRALLSFYLMFMLMGTLTMITEWDKIKCSKGKKIWYLFLFPVFLFTYVPISVIALFKKVVWRPVEHTEAKTLDEVR